LFLPAWGFLAWSFYSGVQVQGAYLAYLFQFSRDPGHVRQTVNSDAYDQMLGLEWGLLFLALWLALYLYWRVLKAPEQRNSLEDPDQQA